MIDQAWSGAIDPHGLSLSAESEAFSTMLADVRIAMGVLRGVATAAEAAGGLTSRQCAEIVGEALSRRGYGIDMADLTIMAGSPDEEVYLYLAKRADLGSFIYVAESHAEGVGLIRDMIGVVDDGPDTVSIFATASLVASGTAERTQSAEWRVAPRDYVILKEWLNARQGASGGQTGW